ncbi:hypothetical protein [Bdellovibrio bacteriovorus]|uniref:hypothetical protein n=1 Tax=Bdellovibrio TaxID=958 RepID=UPI0035A94184
MNKIILFISVLMLSKFALAATPANIELCALEIPNESAADAPLTEEIIFDVKKAASISAFHLSLINKYYQAYNEDPKLTLTFAELKKLFGKGGEESYNDLYILKYVSKATGRTYLEVRAYPGDNAVGTVFDGITGEVLAENGDGSFSLVTSDGYFSCYEVNKDKY